MESYGSYIYNKLDDEHYLDLFGMWSSLALGWSHSIFDAEFEQALLETSRMKIANNVVMTQYMVDWHTKFRPHVFSDNIHLCCTGSLAVESALKSALEVKEGEIFGLIDGFHGINSWGVITSDTYDDRLYDIFGDYPIFDNAGIEYILKRGRANTSAVIVELIQCTNGDVRVEPYWLHKLQRMCKAKNICFIIDEIQTGFGVTGDMWYYKQIGLDDPDILIFGKKAQVSGIVTSDKYAKAMNSPHMKLSVTFDGDLIDVIRSTYILRAYEQYNLLEKAKENAEIFRQFFTQNSLPARIRGNLIAFDLPSREARDEFCDRCYSSRLLVNKGGEKTIRLRPHMAITPAEIDHAITIMEEVLCI